MSKLLIVGGIIAVAVLALVLLSPANDVPTSPVDIDTTDTTDTADTVDTDVNPEEGIMEAESDTASGPTIVNLAVETESLSTLVAAVTAAGLVDILNSEGPFTVLAPQNSAFDALPAGTVDTLLEPDNVEQLQGVLANHVIPGTALSTDLADGMTVTTLAGEELLVEVSAAGEVTIGGATVVTADVEASNGVVHIIDTVIVPTT